MRLSRNYKKIGIQTKYITYIVFQYIKLFYTYLRSKFVLKLCNKLEIRWLHYSKRTNVSNTELIVVLDLQDL